MIGVDYEQIHTRLQNLPPGSRVVYFIGYLDSERLERPRGIAAGVADAAFALHREGRVHLVQRRLGPPVFRSVIDRRFGCGPGFEYAAIGREVTHGQTRTQHMDPQNRR